MKGLRTISLGNGVTTLQRLRPHKPRRHLRTNRLLSLDVERLVGLDLPHLRVQYALPHGKQDTEREALLSVESWFPHHSATSHGTPQATWGLYRRISHSDVQQPCKWLYADDPIPTWATRNEGSGPTGH